MINVVMTEQNLTFILNLINSKKEACFTGIIKFGINNGYLSHAVETLSVPETFTAADSHFSLTETIKGIATANYCGSLYLEFNSGNITGYYFSHNIDKSTLLKGVMPFLYSLNDTAFTGYAKVMRADKKDSLILSNTVDVIVERPANVDVINTMLADRNFNGCVLIEYNQGIWTGYSYSKRLSLHADM